MAVNFTKRETTDHYVPLDENTRHTYKTKQKQKTLLTNIPRISNMNLIKPLDVITFYRQYHEQRNHKDEI